MRIKILDCTIRDGGHLNKWKFDLSCVKAAYYAALNSGVDYFEVGYRNPPEKEGLGPFGYCRDDILFELFATSEQCKLTVMIDAGKCESTLFTECMPEKTPVRAVRVAAYPYELQKAIRLVEELHEKGYEVTLNFMACSELSEREYNFLRSWKNKDILLVAYFADSFGSFIPSDIPKFINRLRDTGFKCVGYHPHNSLQQAFANALQAIEVGVDFIDASIYGMGRGSGNLPIELIVGYLEKVGHSEFNVVPYLDLIERYFLKIYKEIGWGYGLESLMSGLANIHPYYVENLFKDRLYTIDEIWNVLHTIKEKCPISFSPDKMQQELEKRFYTPITPEKAKALYKEIRNQQQIIPATDAFSAGDFPFKDTHKGRIFLIIANGPSILEYKDVIDEFRRTYDCVTIGMNNLEKLFEPDYHVFISRKRFLQYIHNILDKSTLLLPSFFGRELVKINYSGPVYFYDMVAPCDPNTPPLDGSVQCYMTINVAVSAILIAYQMGAKEIYVVGMDGYVDEFNKKMVYFYNEDNKIEDKDLASLRYEMLAKELNRVNNFLQGKSVPFFILTPTSHKKYYKSFKKV